MKTEATFGATSCVCDQQEERGIDFPQFLSLWNEVLGKVVLGQ